MLRGHEKGTAVSYNVCILLLVISSEVKQRILFVVVWSNHKVAGLADDIGWIQELEVAWRYIALGFPPYIKLAP